MKETSKGNEAQGGKAVRHPNTVTVGTDLSAEQGPEGPHCFGIGNIGASGNGGVGTVETAAGAKSGRATTVVTRNGCGEGESSGG
jgi:hypothetical protein